jgi:hypothetical protein
LVVLVVRKRTFGKGKSIACIHGRSPVILIQVARFDSVASNTAIGGFKAHRFTLLDHFQSVVVRDSATIRGEVFVHDCHVAKLGIDSVGCARDEIPTSSSFFPVQKARLAKASGNCSTFLLASAYAFRCTGIFEY